MSPEDAFGATLPMSLPTLFRRWCGPIPPIKAVTDQAGDWQRAGENQAIVLAGGGTMRETLTAVDPPHSWRWTLHRKSALTAPALAVFARLWKGCARQSLESLSDYLVG